MSQLDTLLERTRQWAAGLDDIVQSRAVLTRRIVIAAVSTIGVVSTFAGGVSFFITRGTEIRSFVPLLVLVPVVLVLFLVVSRDGTLTLRFWRVLSGVFVVLMFIPAYLNGSIAIVMLTGMYPVYWVILPAAEALGFATLSIVGMLAALTLSSAPVDAQVVVRALAGATILIILTHTIFRHLGGILAGAVHLGASVRAELIKLEANIRDAEAARVEQERRDAATGLLSPIGFASAFAERFGSTGAEAEVLSVRLLRWEETASALELGSQQEGAAVLAGRLSQLTGPEALVGRLGRAEFVVAWDGGQSDTIGTWPRVRDLFAGLRDPVLIDERAILTVPTVGVARFPADGTTLPECLRCAEIARVVAEQMEVDAPSRFDIGMERRLKNRAIDTERLREALATGTFELWYQPVVPTSGGRPTYAEALIRWRDGARGLVGPGEFLPLMSSAGLMPDLTRWALQRAVADVQRIRAAVAPAFRISVNVAPELLTLLDADAALRVFDELGPPSEAITLELTEASFIEITEAVRQVLNSLRARGVKVAVDDFGTGYSSLDRLESLPVDILKIDRAFVRRLDGGAARSVGVIRAVLHLGRELGLEIVAEGVETEAQRAQLAELGCPSMQGYLYSQAVPVDELIALIARTPLAPAS